MTYDARRKTIATEMARGRVSPSIVERVFKSGDDVVGYVFASGEPVAFRDLHEGMEGVSGDAARNGLHSMLAVPLLARGRSIGVLTVFSAGEGAFNDDDMSMLQTFASQAALAIDTARLYSREHEVATLLQQSILPGALPEFDGHRRGERLRARRRRRRDRRGLLRPVPRTGRVDLDGDRRRVRQGRQRSDQDVDDQVLRAFAGRRRLRARAGLSPR